MPTDSYSRTQSAEYLQISERSFRRYVKKLRVNGISKNRELYYDLRSLDFIKEHLSPRGSKGGRPLQGEGSKTDFPEVHEAQVVEQRPDVEPGHYESTSRKRSDTDTAPYDHVLDGGLAEIKDQFFRRSPEENIYKSLYEKTEGDMKLLQERLDLASYRVGSLETQVKTMVPLLEYNKQKKELLSLKEENRSQKNGIAELEKQVRLECFVKKIYAVFLFFMVSLIPILLILRLFSGKL